MADRKPMFEYWLHSASRLALKFGLAPELMVKAHAFVRDRMGPEWVSTFCSHAESAGLGAARLISEAHPLALALKGATEECALDVLRVASYLCAFRSDPKIGEAIVSLRDPDKYDSTMFELALAWSMKRAGARVELFPPTPKGAADIAITVDSTTYPVEASRFPSDTLRDDAMSFLEAINGALLAALTRAGVSLTLVLEIDVDDLDHRDRAPAFVAVKDAVRTFTRGNGERAEVAFSYGRVTLRKPPAPGERFDADDWTNAVRTNRGHMTFLRDLSDDPDPFVRLAKKLKTEAHQLSGCANGVIVIDVERLGVDMINDRGRLHAVALDFARNHRSTTGIGFVVLSYRQSGHRGVSGHYYPLTDGALAESWFRKVLDGDEAEGLFNELRALSER